MTPDTDPQTNGTTDAILIELACICCDWAGATNAAVHSTYGFGVCGGGFGELYECPECGYPCEQLEAEPKQTATQTTEAAAMADDREQAETDKRSAVALKMAKMTGQTARSIQRSMLAVDSAFISDPNLSAREIFEIMAATMQPAATQDTDSA